MDRLTFLHLPQCFRSFIISCSFSVIGNVLDMSGHNDKSDTENTDKKRSLIVITQQTFCDRNSVKLENGQHFIRRKSLPLIHGDSLHKSGPAYPPIHKWRKLYCICQPWRWELLSCTAAILFFITISVVLGAYNNKLLAAWPYGLTINTIISILATFMKIALMIPVAEGMVWTKSWIRSKSDIVWKASVN